MGPFDGYPGSGRTLLGPLRGDNARRGYGLRLQRLTGQTTCAYCGVDLVNDYYRWLLLQVDHVVPTGEAIRLGIPPKYYEDYANLVLACAGCNGFDNRCRIDREPRSTWMVEEFFDLRDAVFAQRSARIAACRERETAFFDGRPWEPGLSEG